MRSVRVRNARGSAKTRRPKGGNAAMNDREKRDFEAGLAADVDAWLNGEPTQRSFITRFGQMTGMIALSGPMLAATSHWALAQAAAELADASTPLGKAQAAALKA